MGLEVDGAGKGQERRETQGWVWCARLCGVQRSRQRVLRRPGRGPTRAAVSRVLGADPALASPLPASLPSALPQSAHFQAARCLYAAHSHLAAGRAREAAALFGRTAERCRQAEERYRECGTPAPAAALELEEVSRQAAAWAAATAAEVAAEGLRAGQAAAEGLGGMSLDGTAGGAAASGSKRSAQEAFLEESLDDWEAFVGEGKGSARICRLPPPPRPVPERPIVLDTALALIEYPPLGHRLPKAAAAPQGAGLVGRLFKGWV